MNERQAPSDSGGKEPAMPALSRRCAKREADGGIIAQVQPISHEKNEGTLSRGVAGFCGMGLQPMSQRD
jgi:hypothetical protein